MTLHSYSLYDGTSTISLSDGVISACTGYVITHPDIESSDLPNQNDDGNEVGYPRYKNVTDTFELMIVGASDALVQTNANSINLMIATAIRRQRQRVGPRVYLQVQLASDSAVWRSEVLYAKLELADDALKVWGNFQMNARLHITRRFYFEGPEKELQLSTSNAAAATGGQTIYNHDDAGTGHDNWVQIAAAQVGGVLPAPVKLVMTHSSGSSVGFSNFWIACNAFSDPANFIHIVEGEARTAGFGTITVDANSSGGNYNLRSFTTTGEIDWPLTAAQMQRTQGRSFRLLMRGVSWTGTNVYVKPVLRASDGQMQLYEGDEILLGSTGTQIIDLGSIPLPNGGYQVAWSDLTLVLQIRCTGAGTLGVDFIQLTPLDAFQWVKQRGFTIANGDVLTFDNIEGIMYTSGQPIFAPLAGVLKVYPGVTQRLIFLNDEGTSSNIARTFSVRAYIRERRLTV